MITCNLIGGRTYTKKHKYTPLFYYFFITITLWFSKYTFEKLLRLPFYHLHSSLFFISTLFFFFGGEPTLNYYIYAFSILFTQPFYNTFFISFLTFFGGEHTLYTPFQYFFLILFTQPFSHSSGENIHFITIYTTFFYSFSYA